MNCRVYLFKLIGFTLLISLVMPAAQCLCNTSAMTNHFLLVATASRFQGCINNSWQHYGKRRDKTTWYILYNVRVAKMFVSGKAKI